MYLDTTIASLPYNSFVSLDEFNTLKSAYNETVELLAKALSRITELENAVFMCDPEGDVIRDHEDVPILSPGLTVANETLVVEPEQSCPETTLDQKACAVVEYLKEEMKPNDFGEFVIGRKELTTFMQGIIPESLRVKNVSRQLKADLFERAVKLFPGIVYIKKSPSGNKTKSLALKQSVKRTNTDSHTRLAGLGIWG